MSESPELAALRKRLVFRRATEKDYSSVLDIDRKLYGGWDYIPALYHNIIKHPNTIATVAELDGKVVSENKMNSYQ